MSFIVNDLEYPNQNEMYSIANQFGLLVRAGPDQGVPEDDYIWAIGDADDSCDETCNKLGGHCRTLSNYDNDVMGGSTASNQRFRDLYRRLIEADNRLGSNKKYSDWMNWEMELPVQSINFLV